MRPRDDITTQSATPARNGEGGGVGRGEPIPPPQKKGTLVPRGRRKEVMTHVSIIFSQEERVDLDLAQKEKAPGGNPGQTTESLFGKSVPLEEPEVNNGGPSGPGGPDNSPRSYDELKAIALAELPTMTDSGEALRLGCGLIDEALAKAKSENPPLGPRSIGVEMVVMNVRGSRKRVTGWTRAINNHVQELEEADREERRNRQHQGNGDITIGTIWPDVPPEDYDKCIPGKYSVVVDGGVYFLKKETAAGTVEISKQPIYVRSHLVDVEDPDGSKLELAYWSYVHHRWETTIIASSMLTDARAFGKIVDRKIMVHPSRLGHLREYLYEMLEIGEIVAAGLKGMEIQQTPLVSRLGMFTIGGQTSFASMKGSIGPVMARVDVKDDNVRRWWGTEPVGTPEGEKATFLRVIKERPPAGYFAGSAAAAPMLRELRTKHQSIDVDSFVVEVAGDQDGTGKTTILNLATTPWGSPDLVRPMWDTPLALIEVAKYQSDLPLFRQEAQAAASGGPGRRPNTMDLATAIHAMADGGGKGQAKRDGGTRHLTRLYNVLMMANNVAASSLVTDDGLRARIITLPPVLGPKDLDADGPNKKYADQLAADMAQNYGHGGPALIKTLVEIVNDPDQSKALNQRYIGYTAKLVAAIPAGTQNAALLARVAKKAAAGWLGTWGLLHLGYDVPEAEELAERAALAAWALVVTNAGNRDTDRQRVMASIGDYATMSMTRIAGLEARDQANRPMMPTLGYVGALSRPDGTPVVGLTLDPLAKYLEGQGFAHPKTILHGLREEGKVLASPARPTELTRDVYYETAGGVKLHPKMVVFRREDVLPGLENVDDPKTPWPQNPGGPLFTEK